MDTDQTWYRQLLGVILLSAAKAAAEYIADPNAKDEAVKQVRSQLQSIDTDSIANAVTQAIDALASSSKERLNDTIDTLRESAADAVSETKSRADERLGKKKSHRGRFVFGILLGAVIAYFLFDEQRRDDLLDRLTGASGPIQPPTTTFGSNSSTGTSTTPPTTGGTASTTAQQSAQSATDAGSTGA